MVVPKGDFRESSNSEQSRVLSWVNMTVGRGMACFIEAMTVGKSQGLEIESGHCRKLFEKEAQHML